MPLVPLPGEPPHYDAITTRSQLEKPPNARTAQGQGRKDVSLAGRLRSAPQRRPKHQRQDAGGRGGDLTRLAASGRARRTWSSDSAGRTARCTTGSWLNLRHRKAQRPHRISAYPLSVGKPPRRTAGLRQRTQPDSPDAAAKEAARRPRDDWSPSPPRVLTFSGETARNVDSRSRCGRDAWVGLGDFRRRH